MAELLQGLPGQGPKPNSHRQNVRQRPIETFPSQMAQTIMKARLKGAQTGPNLLKKKSDALTLQFRQILKKIIETKILMSEMMREAAFPLAEAKFIAGDFSTTLRQNVNKAQVKIRAKKDNVAGVTLPVFEHYHEGTDSYELTGLARGGEQLAKLKRNYAWWNWLHCRLPLLLWMKLLR